MKRTYMFLIFRACLALALLTGASLAQSSRFSFDAALTFNPNRVVAVDGGALGALITEFYGPAASQGQVPSSAQISYVALQAPTTANANAAGYRNAPSAVQVSLGSNVATLDLGHSVANSATSKIGLTTWPDGGFCADFEHCQHIDTVTNIVITE